MYIYLVIQLLIIYIKTLKASLRYYCIFQRRSSGDISSFTYLCDTSDLLLNIIFILFKFNYTNTKLFIKIISYVLISYFTESKR